MVVAALEKAGNRASLSCIGVQFNKKWRTCIPGPLTCLYTFFLLLCWVFVTDFSIEIESLALLKKFPRLRVIRAAISLDAHEFFHNLSFCFRALLSTFSRQL